MKPLERIFSHPACEIYYNEDLHIVQTVWNDVEVSSIEFRKILDNIVKALKRSSAGVIIADARRMHPIRPEDQQWIIDSWYPRAVSAGFQYQGLILLPQSYNELAVKEISENYDEHIVHTYYFTTINEALGWLKELKLVD